MVSQYEMRLPSWRMKENGLRSSATCEPRPPPTWGTERTARRGNGRQSRGYAQASGAVIVDWFYDAAVSGADPIEVRPGFAELLARIADNGVRTIIVETANRFARDLMVQEVGYAMLRSLGVTLVAAD